MTASICKQMKDQSFSKNVLEDCSDEKELVLCTVRQFCSKYPWPSQSALRALILNSEINGFEKAFVRVGRRVLVNIPMFFQIIQKINQKGANE